MGGRSGAQSQAPGSARPMAKNDPPHSRRFESFRGTRQTGYRSGEWKRCDPVETQRRFVDREAGEMRA